MQRDTNTPTREQIVAMKPGWELDALVAEKVMGWKLKNKPDVWVDAGGEYHVVGSTHYRMRHDFFNPSTDISAAWRVVDKIGRFYLTNNSPSKNYEMRFIGTGETIIGDTLPHAICLAALLAARSAEVSHE